MHIRDRVNAISRATALIMLASSCESNPVRPDAQVPPEIVLATSGRIDVDQNTFLFWKIHGEVIVDTDVQTNTIISCRNGPYSGSTQEIFYSALLTLNTGNEEHPDHYHVQGDVNAALQYEIPEMPYGIPEGTKQKITQRRTLTTYDATVKVWRYHYSNGVWVTSAAPEGQYPIRYQHRSDDQPVGVTCHDQGAG